MANNFGSGSEPMNFGESISTCLKKYFVFDGGASKSEFWYFFLVYTVGSFVLGEIATSIMSPALLIVSGLITFGTIIPFAAVGCRRLHDINKSGWWQLIPIYNLILWAQDSSEGSTPTRSARSSNFNEPTQNRSVNNDLTDELEELEELYKDGTLSEAQFKKAKNKLLK